MYRLSHQHGSYARHHYAFAPLADKKIKTHTKSTIRRRVIQSHKNTSDKPESAAGPAGSRRVIPQQSVLWTGKRRQGVREAAGVQGTLFMGYGEGGGSEEGEELQAARAGEGGDGPGAFNSVERWENTVSVWGRRSRLRYQVDLIRGSAESVEPTARQPSYAVRFYGYVKDDHRDIPLENCAASDVTNGPVLPTAVYEARALALAATCLAWSPTYCANRGEEPTCTSAASAGTATTPDSTAAPAATATVATAEQSDGVSRCCVLAIGNKLGQVAMWRLGLPPEYVHRMQDRAERSGPESKITADMGPLSASKCSRAETSSRASSCSSPLLQWMGQLQVHKGGAHVLRLTWCVAPECGTAAAAVINTSEQAAQVPGPATASSSGQWHVPQPHSAGQRDSLLLLTGLSDGSILLWSVSAATFTRASDLTLLSEICSPDGLAPTAIDCTWLLLSDPLQHRTRHHQLTTCVTNTNTNINRPANGMHDTTAQQQPQHWGPVDGRARARRRKDTEVEAVQVGVADVPDAEEVEDSGTLGTGDAYNQDYDYGISATMGEAQVWEAGHTGGPWGRRLLIVASKPCGAVFAWRSGCWRPRTAESEEGPMQADFSAVAADGIDKVYAGDLATACKTVNGAGSCLHSAVHGSFHCGGVALAAGRPLVVSGGTDGAVKCWLVSELELPMSAVGAVPLPARRRYLPPALQLTEVPEGIYRLDPCSASLPELPPQVQSLPLARQAVHGVAASGNGLVFAVLRTTSTRQLDIAKNVMIHGRVLGGSVHLMTPYSMAAAAAPLLPLLPRMLAAGLMFQAPVASCLWDIHAMTLRAGMVEAMALPPVPAEAWDTEMDCEATVVDDAAALEQVQGTVGGNMDDGADGGGAGAGGNMDLGRARLAALVRQDTEERRRAKLITS
ncbi:hypothetical protein Vafri_19033 [Volvox africanus]|uniref:Uncharacterized protein n=1 Tax=Volvox africanus TaxID=51714 RepID=A0A8J4BPN0_9CHLO|nr:hypothetical protein Vafri_19033 [Volvox africanus]